MLSICTPHEKLNNFRTAPRTVHLLIALPKKEKKKEKKPQYKRHWSTEMANEDKLSSQQFSQRWETSFMFQHVYSKGCSNTDGFLLLAAGSGPFLFWFSWCFPWLCSQTVLSMLWAGQALQLPSNQQLSARSAPFLPTGQIHWRQQSPARTRRENNQVRLQESSVEVESSFHSILWETP